MRAIVLVLGLAATSAAPLGAQVRDGVLARCGESEGQGYFFQDDFWNPDGPEWSKDGITGGQIVLVRLGEEWDIQFADIAGAHGYRADGAVVMPLGSTETMLTVGAFRGNYADVYTFNFAGSEVVWTSHKIDVMVSKVAVYRADCTFTVPSPG
jgi:hypothetical protein